MNMMTTDYRFRHTHPRRRVKKDLIKENNIYKDKIFKSFIKYYKDYFGAQSVSINKQNSLNVYVIFYD